MGECVGYQALSSSEWVKKTWIARALENGDVDVHVFPTDLGFEKAKNDYNKLWDQAFGTVPYPKGMTDAQGSSMYTQLACHARYVFKLPNGEWNTHESWDMESWRPDVSWDYGMNPATWLIHKCNWRN
ncbi:DUF2599 domain-containing protein [Streptomyces sp. NPDC048258]|uniref:DUF2599 domain-containing protein n=1 Tax=Streptomyces sp. NPDC048258 TaxID=3365527 RepID=UPI00371FBB69